MDIKFKIDPTRMTFGNLIALDEYESMSKKEVRDLMASFLVDDRDEFVDRKKAIDILDALTLEQLTGVITQFHAKVVEVGHAALPKANETGLSDPSTTMANHPSG